VVVVVDRMGIKVIIAASHCFGLWFGRAYSSLPAPSLFFYYLYTNISFGSYEGVGGHR